MRRAIEGMCPVPEYLLIDGLPVPGLPRPSRSIVKGDGLSLSIAAASVLAKVTRDRLLAEVDRTYPGYGFAVHKGYPTPAHLDALHRLGPCPAHRRSFGPVRACGGTLAASSPALPGLVP
jgi:ribonuclease HII